MIFGLIFLFFAAILAFWLSAICGGGASLILIPILNSFLPISIVPFSLTIGTCTSSASRIVVFKKHICWKIFFWFVPFSIPAVLLGAWALKFANPFYLQLIVAFFLISNLPQLFKSKSKLKQNERPYPNYILAIVGFCAGFVSGVTGAIGLLFNRFYLNYGLSKEEIIATRAANEIFLHAIKLIVYFTLGFYSNNALWLGLAIGLASIVSSFAIPYILPYISEYIFKKIGYGAMVLSGLTLLFSASLEIIHKDKLNVSVEQFENKQETALFWRENSLVFEYTFNEGLEIERSISFDELPPALRKKYEELINDYDKILLEKVFKYRQRSSYEFYCFKNGALTKMEFKDEG